MAGDLLARLKTSPVLCDGAMGTLLYAKGIFINRCYDELNVSQPDLIRGLHHEYLQAGAEIIETNTFGGNSFRLARHGMENRVREINLAGVRLGREARLTDTDLHALVEAARLKAVTDALRRIETGEWGLCANCQEPIPETRLDAVP